MTPTTLNTTLPLSYIKRSKKLQELNQQIYGNLMVGSISGGMHYPLNIADIINSAEELFGESLLSVGLQGEREKRYKFYSHQILSKIFNGESIEEISEYIIKSIKE